MSFTTTGAVGTSSIVVLTVPATIQTTVSFALASHSSLSRQTGHAPVTGSNAGSDVYVLVSTLSHCGAGSFTHSSACLASTIVHVGTGALEKDLSTAPDSDVDMIDDF
ncbi:hypothetical protein AURDEDRAFT_172372 [Auricularia subglabra TFB-10046 SS5]|nr:hypothetical protein AURDEDRAFT_172372 [Auricularia subglabra TFB-10046 SS5]